MPRFRGREITHRAPRPPRFGAPWWLGTCLEQRVRGLARRGAGGLESSSISGVRNSEANTPTCACDARAARRCMLPPGNRFRCPGRDNRQCSCRLPRPSMATFSCRPVLPSSMHLSSRCTGAAKTSPKGGVVRVSASGATTTSDKASQKKNTMQQIRGKSSSWAAASKAPRPRISFPCEASLQRSWSGFPWPRRRAARRAVS